MSVKYGFFNSINNDRLYNALDMGRMFDGLIHDGVFATIGDHMMVQAKGGFRLVVGTGKAWFNHTWTIVDSAYSLMIEPADSILKRIDIIVLEVNNMDAIRKNSIKIIKGNPSANPIKPDLIHEDRVNQYPLAYVSVPNGISEVTQSNITNTIGTTVCPFVTAVNQSVTVDELLQQWIYQFNDFMRDAAKEFNDWQIAEKQSFDDWERQVQFEFEQWRNNEKKEFDDWWDDIIDTLNEVSLGDFAVRFIQAEKDIIELNRHVDTFEEYGQTYYRTLDYEPHKVDPTIDGNYGNLNNGEYLNPGIYVFEDVTALQATNHAPSNAAYGGVMRVYDTGGSNIKSLMNAIDSIDKPFNIIQEFEYRGGAIPKVRRFITQTTTERKYSKWMFTDEKICRKNVPVASNGWSGSGIQKYIYKAEIPVEGITADWYADVTFDINSVLKNKLASFTNCINGKVVIYSKAAFAMTIPLIVCHQGTYLDSEVII